MGFVTVSQRPLPRSENGIELGTKTAFIVSDYRPTIVKDTRAFKCNVQLNLGVHELRISVIVDCSLLVHPLAWRDVYNDDAERQTTSLLAAETTLIRLYDMHDNHPAWWHGMAAQCTTFADNLSTNVKLGNV